MLQDPATYHPIYPVSRSILNCSMWRTTTWGYILTLTSSCTIPMTVVGQVDLNTSDREFVNIRDLDVD